MADPSAPPAADAPAHRRAQGAADRPTGVAGGAARAPGAGAGGQVWVQLSSAMGSSVVAALVTTPFDVVKTRMQVSPPPGSQPGLGGSGRCLLQTLNPGVDRSLMRACCVLHPGSGLLCGGTAGAVSAAVEAPVRELRVVAPRANSYQTMVAIARAEGVLALWRGTGPNIMTCIPSVGIYLTIYEQLKALATARGVSPQLAPLLAGGMARAVSVVCTSPLDLMRTRVMAQAGAQAKPVGAVAVLVRTMAKGGWQSLWRGTTPTLYRDVPFSAFYWMVAESARNGLAARWGAKRDAVAVNLSAGLIAGTGASVLTHPFDVVKTRAQVDDAPAPGSASKYRGGGTRTLAIVRHQLATEGWASLWAGIGPRVLKVGPSCAIVLGSYELFKSFLNK
eukprot:Tamp_15380.p1 GENE.Tamp_15380~~Tamp_15380.p1  ORF type:complete len:392 (+),score=70.41 Tamp_15380:212-1387(+)